MSWLLPPLPPKWEAALRDVRAQKPEARVAAAQRLAAPEPGQLEAALEGLSTLCGDRDARVRAAAVDSLGDLADPRALLQLTEATRDADALVRELAVLALARLPAENALPALLAAAHSEHPELRFQAIGSVAEIAPEQAVPQIARLLADPDVRVRGSAAHAASIVDEQLHTQPLLQALTRALRDEHAEVRGAAAIVLAQRGDAVACDALIAALDDPELVWAALDAAPHLNDPRLRDRIARLALSYLRSRMLKAAAGRALARMNDDLGVAALREVLEGFRAEGRTFAVETIGELRLTQLTPHLVRLARRPRGTDRVVLAKALGRLALDRPEARAALRQLALRDDEAGAQSHAELARLDTPTPPPSGLDGPQKP